MKLFYENPVSTCVDNLTAIITYDIIDDYGRKRYDQEMEFTGSQSELRHRLKELRLMGAYNIDVDTEPCFYESKSKFHERLKEQVEDFEDTKDIVLIKSWLEDNGFDYEYIKSNQSASWFNINGQKRRIPRLNPKKNKVYSYMDNIRSLIESKSKLKEQDVEIEVKHEGILEVPEGKNVDDLPISHFEKLAKKKGLGKITKALNNLQVWNKNDDPKLSKWARDMIDKLNKKFDKKESLLKLNERDNFNCSITSAADYYYHRWKSEVMDSSQIRDELVRKFGHSEDFADEVIELILDKYDDDQRYWDEYDESLIHKRLKKDEAVSRKRTSTRFRNDSSNSVGRFLDNQIKSGKIDKKQITVVYDKNNNIMWLGKAGSYPLFMSNIEYRSSGYDADHPNELWINARSYTTPFEESFNNARFRNRKNRAVK